MFLVPQRRLRRELLRSSLELVHPYVPIIDVHEFLHAIHQDGGESISLLLCHVLRQGFREYRALSLEAKFCRKYEARIYI